MQVTNQSMIYTLGHSVRSRVTSGYMVCYFAGGAIGSALANSIYDQHGWAGVCLLGAGIGTIATASAILDTARRTAAPTTHL
jgi:predicted MFS family arabinose efflux permease